MLYTIGDDIESVGESRVDVETGNEEGQEPEECGHAVYRGWCAVCVKGRCVGKIEPLEEEERERTTPMVIAFSWHMRTQTYFQSSFVATTDMTKSHFWSISSLESLRIILKDENEPSLKVFQEVMIYYSCVEVVVREMKRQCRILGISAEHNTSVRITD